MFICKVENVVSEVRLEEQISSDSLVVKVRD